MQELEKTLLKETEQLVNMHYEDDSVKTIILRNLRDIRKHMSGKDIDVPANDGWIPVEKRLPEVFGKYWATIRYDDGRISEPVVVNFQGVKQKYVVDTPNGREYETWGIDSAFHGSRVIAWREYYIPEPYRPKKESEGSRRLREREEFFKE